MALWRGEGSGAIDIWGCQKIVEIFCAGADFGRERSFDGQLSLEHFYQKLLQESPAVARKKVLQPVQFLLQY